RPSPDPYIPLPSSAGQTSRATSPYAPSTRSLLIAPKDNGRAKQGSAAPSPKTKAAAPGAVTAPMQGTSGFVVFETVPVPSSVSTKASDGLSGQSKRWDDTKKQLPIKGVDAKESHARVTYQPPQRPNLQPGVPPQRQSSEQSLEYQIQLEPPGPQRLFQLESERSLQERMRQEARERPVPERIVFPEEPIVTGGAPNPRPFPP